MTNLFLALRPTEDHHLTVGIILLNLIFMVAVKWNKPNYFFSYLSSLYDMTFFNKKFLEKRRIEISEVFIFLSSHLGLSFFLYVIYDNMAFYIMPYLQIFLLLLIFLLSKYLIEKMIGDLFQVHQLVNKYLFFKQGVLSWISLFILFPFGLLIYFQNIDHTFLITLVIVIVAILYIGKLLTYVISYQKHILSHWVYFILYLCTFEIAPYLILFKVFNTN
jgi:hypothetical protein